MKAGMNQSQELSQKLMITPELQQSIHILQLSSYELSQYLQEQAMENPVLEMESYGFFPEIQKVLTLRECHRSSREGNGRRRNARTAAVQPTAHS